MDRRALPEPDTSRPPLDAPEVAPRTPIEAQLAGLWADVLGETFRAELSVQTLLNTPTVASRAEAIVQRLAEQAEPAIVAPLLAELGPVRRD